MVVINEWQKKMYGCENVRFVTVMYAIDNIS